MIKESFKKRKLLTVLVMISVISFISGILFVSILSSDNQILITDSINNYFNSISNGEISYLNNLYSIMISNLLMGIFIWIIGISIIGVIIVSGILIFKCFLVGFSFSSIIYTYRLKGVLLGCIYMLPEVLNLFITFLLTYYSISFSCLLFNYLFRKKEYNKNVIVRRYIKVLLVIVLLFIISSLFSVFAVPNILKLLYN